MSVQLLFILSFFGCLVACKKSSEFTHQVHFIEGIGYDDDGKELHCKLTREGTEYLGTLDRTSSGKLCQDWSVAVFEKGSNRKTSARTFPDGSVKGAQNFCRNPSAESGGPWCFVDDKFLVKESCDVSFCKQSTCRLTGVGEGLDFSVFQSVFGEACSAWKKDTYLKAESANCANPTKSIAGPWCFVGDNKKQPCDVPICNFSDCGTVSASQTMFSHFAFLAGRKKLRLKFKAWDASLDSMAQGVKILISSVPHLEGNVGFQIEIRPPHLGGGVVLSKWPQNNKELGGGFETFKRGIDVSGARWEEVLIEWDDEHIKIGESSLGMAIDFDQQLQFYSVGGLMAMWETENCCQEHVTTSLSFVQMWPLPKTIESGFKAEMSVRAFRSTAIQLLLGPDISLGYYQINLDNFLRNDVYWIDEKGVSTKKYENENQVPIFKSFWQWQQLTLKIFGDELQLLMLDENKELQLLVKVKEPKVRGLRWFSIGSKSTLAHWLINCNADETALLAASLPDVSHCLRDAVGFEYRGEQAASSRGWPCLPWTHPAAVSDELRQPFLYPDGSAAAAHNFCRNPSRRLGGPWCYTLRPGFPAKSCGIPECAAQNCRFSGTGNDYMGNLSTTISNRTCQKWTEMSPHVIDWEIAKDENFPERSAENASNFCRNPSRDMVGSYCFTNDPRIRVDACHVPNCRFDIKESQTLIVKGGAREGRSMFVAPKWRGDGIKFSVKQWNPLGSDGLRITLRPRAGDASLIIVIGAERNSLIKVTYQSLKTGDVQIYKRKVSHIVGVAAWSSFTLHVDAASVVLGFADHPFPFLNWKSDGADFSLFSPVCFSVGSELNNLLGLNFPQEDCMTFQEDVKEAKFFQLALQAHLFFRVHQWQKSSKLVQNSRLDLYIRGAENGKFGVALSTLGDFENGYDLIRFSEKSIEFGRVTSENEMQINLERNYTANVIPSIIFRQFTIKFSDDDLDIWSDDASIEFHWTHKHGGKNLWHIFTTAAQGKFIWSVNCKPQDVDRIQDGGWSEWSDWKCSAACGNSGRGFRTRSCTSPEPSVLGRYCAGESKVTGACNRFPCGKVSYDTRRKIRKFFNSKANSLELKAGQSLNFSCQPSFVNSVLQELYVAGQDVMLDWAKEGVFLKKSKNVTFYSKSNLEVEQGGVYSLQVRRKNEPTSAVPVCVFTLAVQRRLEIRAHQQLVLDAKVGELALLYNTLVVRWLRGNVIVKRFALNPNQQKHELRMDVGVEDSSEWRCVVVQPDLGLSWTTAWYQVHVLPSRSLGMFLAELPIISLILKPATNVFGEWISVPLFSLLVAGAFAATRCFVRRRRRRSASST